MFYIIRVIIVKIGCLQIKHMMVWYMNLARESWVILASLSSTMLKGAVLFSS